eukprot:TRINITY_DN2845_c0_g1_i2.p1 TRINITY_DN2845_c0_g1~~TRINITY_DN2845_c0_g1_i2.p1  ORF type:complete len:182 (+),score=28.72 TRINITY_DN2845_c0_g1_i2:437-982(+)
MAAISTTILSFVKAGDHAIVTSFVYGGTEEVFAHVLPRFGVEVSWINSSDISAYASQIKKNTTLMFGETPNNPNLNVVDLEAFGKLGREHNILTVIDGTFASPYNQTPIKYGVDISIHSATKYLGGHADILAGTVTTRTKEQFQKVWEGLKLFGGSLSPFDAFLLNRGIKTLPIRFITIML